MREPYLDIFDSYHYCAPYHEIKVRLYTYVNIERKRSSRAWLERLTANFQSRDSPGFDPSILRHSGIRGEADEAVLNKVETKKPF
jgi:hypothetical protein